MQELPSPRRPSAVPDAGSQQRERAAVGAPPGRAAFQNPFDVSGPYATAMRLALGLALLPGLGTALLLVVVAGMHLPLAIAWPQLAQAHGQIQTLGFVLPFIVAVGLQLFPRFLGSPLTHAERGAWGCGILALALTARLVGQPLAPSAARVALLAAAVVGVPVGGLALGGALGLCVWSGLVLALGGEVVPVGLDEALIHLELAGFAVALVFAVGSRVFGRFLLLQTRPALEQRIPLLAWLWGAGLVVVVLGWLLDVQGSVWLRWLGSLIELGVLVTWLWLVGLYDLPSRESGTPYVTNPTRRWVRLAFAFALFSVSLNVGLFGREALLGVAPSITELSAARHALGQGFLMPLMVTMAARMLPVVSADAVKHRLRLEVIVDLLLAGALVRVAAEVTGGYSAETGPLVALGGTLSIVGFALFAAGMWSSLGRLPRARAATAAASAE